MRGYFLILLVVLCFFSYAAYQVLEAGQRVANKLNDQLTLIQQQGK